MATQLRNKSLRQISALLASIAVVCVLSACSKSLSEAEAVASAKSSIDKGDLKGATILVKDALQKYPQSAELRLKLGEILYAGGDPGGALVEFGKAQDLKLDDNRLLPALARAQLAVGQVKKVTDEFDKRSLSDTEADASLKSTVGLAHFLQGNVARSQELITEALRLNPKDVSARTQQARLSARKREFDAALALLDAVIADNPKAVEPQLLKGEILWGGKSNAEGAIQAFRQVLTVDPRLPGAHEALLTLYLQSGDQAKFKTQVAELQKALPGSLISLYYGIKLSLLDKDLVKARADAQQLLRVDPKSVRSLQLAGVVELETDDVMQAQAHLAQAVQLAPEDAYSRQLLATAYLKTGQPALVLETVKPLLEVEKPTAEVLNLAAQAYLQDGRFDQAMDSYQRAAKANPKDLTSRVALAAAQASKGKVGAAVKDLESLASADTGTVADYALMSVLLQNNDVDGALKALDRIVVKTPKDPLPLLLRGRALRFQKKDAAARESFEKALALNERFLLAVEALAMMDEAEKKPDDAKKRYQAVIARDPANYRTRLALAGLLSRTGSKPAEIEPLLKDAIKAAPAEPAPRLALIQQQLTLRKVDDALNAAQDALAAIPGNPQLMMALGQCQVAKGDSQSAITTFRKIAGAQPKFPDPYLAMADLHLRLGETSKASANYRQALEAVPGLLAAQKGLVEVAMAGKQVSEALAITRQVQQQRPREAVGFLMEAAIHSSQKARDPALAALQAAFEREPSTPLATQVYSGYAAAGRSADAARFAAGWRKKKPDDLDFVFNLGSVAMANKDYAEAEARYREVLAANPENALTLNNIAWLMVVQGKPGAVELAEHANRVAPDQAPFMDTLAQALAAERQAAKGLEWAQKAVAKLPDKPEYRLTLAKLLVETGDRTQARAELQRLKALGEGFAKQGEVAGLLAKL